MMDYQKAVSALNYATEADGLVRLEWLRVAQDQVNAAVTEQVGRLRVFDDATWAQIGDALGITRQAAQQRYRS